MSEDFSLVTGSRDRIGVLFVDEGVNLHSDPAMIVYDPPRDAWSFPVHIAPEKPDPQQRAEAVRGVWNGERVDVAYRSLPASAEGGQNDPPTTTLVLASTLVAPDLAVTPEAVYRYYGPQKGGELVTIHVQVVNRGLDTAKGISLDIVEYNMTSMTSGYWRMFKDLRLRPGESTILPIEYRLPKSSSSPYKLFFEAHSLDGRELNTGNNSAPILFAEPDLGLGEITMTRTGFDRTFRVPIENRSPVRVRGVTLTLFNELQKGDVIERKSFEYIEPYTTAVAELTVHLGNLRWPVDTKRLLFEVESSDVMKAGAHSEPFVIINPYSYPAFSLAVFEARGDGGGYVWVSAAASNNHPVERSGDLVIELLDRRGTREGEPWTERVVVQPGHAGIVSHMFKVNENPSSYTVRVTTKNVPKTMPGAPETGGLVDVGGDPVPVEAPVAAESR
jgi:hypothetical protein